MVRLNEDECLTLTQYSRAPKRYILLVRSGSGNNLHAT